MIKVLASCPNLQNITRNIKLTMCFFDPIADYMEKIYCSGFQLYFHLEEQLHLMLPWLFQYLVYFCFKNSQEIQVSYQIDDWIHWKFHVP